MPLPNTLLCQSGNQSCPQLLQLSGVVSGFQAASQTLASLRLIWILSSSLTWVLVEIYILTYVSIDDEATQAHFCA